VNKPEAPNSPDPSVRAAADRRRALRAEVIGLLVIALAVLLYTVLRYGAHINWSAR
jgi:hypothetical protein